MSPLINRVLDSNVFGSGNLENSFCIDDEEFRHWFENRRISYYHEEERGILFLQYCSRQCPAMGRVSNSHPNFDALLEECDFGDLQGLLFMFSVSCFCPTRMFSVNAIFNALNYVKGLKRIQVYHKQ